MTTTRRRTRRPAAAVTVRRFRSSASGEWPRGIYWHPGEIRSLPVGYPIPQDADGQPLPPPAWLEETDAPDHEGAPEDPTDADSDDGEDLAEDGGEGA